MGGILSVSSSISLASFVDTAGETFRARIIQISDMIKPESLAKHTDWTIIENLYANEKVTNVHGHWYWAGYRFLLSRLDVPLPCFTEVLQSEDQFSRKYVHRF
jgi:hypothetical protein